MLRSDVFERLRTTLVLSGMVSEQKSLRKEMSAMHFNV